MRIFPSGPAKEKALRERMKALGIFESDIEETFLRSRGKGGQKLNKTSTRVHLRHTPSGTEVKCQKQRTQALNRYHARVILLEKIQKQASDREDAERDRREKRKRQHRKRPRKAKEGMLEDKRRVAQKKKLRQRVTASADRD